MPERFHQQQETITLPRGYDPWDLLIFLEREARRIVPESEPGERFKLYLTDGEVTGANVRELRSEESDWSRIDRVYFSITLRTTKIGQINSSGVFVWAYGTPRGDSNRRLRIDGDSYDETQARGWVQTMKSRAERFIEAPTNIEDEAGEPKPTSAQVALPPATPETTGGWLHRTWRDHTATFVVTLVAGILVILIAVWLGLQN